MALLATPHAESATAGRTQRLAPSAAEVISGPGAWHVVDSATPASERPEILLGSRSIWCGRYDPCWSDSVGYSNMDYEILYLDTGTHSTDYTLTLRMSVAAEAAYDHLFLIGGGAGAVDPIGNNDVILDEIINTGIGVQERLLVTWTGSIQSNTPGAKSINTTGGPAYIDDSDDSEPDIISTSIQIASGHRALYFVFKSDELLSHMDGLWTVGSGVVLDTLATSDHGLIYSDAPAAGGVDAFGGTVIVGTPGAPVVSSRRATLFWRRPSITAPANQTATEGQTVSLTATASDPDGADVVSVTAFGYPAGLALTQTSGNPASVTLSGSLGAGTAAGSPYRIRWCADSNGTDVVGATSTLVVQASSDQPPVVIAPANVTRTELSFIEVHVSASDPDGPAIAALAADLSSLPPGHDAVFTVGAANTAGVMTWTPGAGNAGSYPVRFTATNVFSGSDTTLIQVTPVATGVGGGSAAPRVLALAQNRPNPFNPSTLLQYQVPREGLVTLRIYDARSRRVTTLVRRRLPPGDYQAVWDGRDDRGRAASSGVYTCRLEAGGVAVSRRIVLIR